MVKKQIYFDTTKVNFKLVKDISYCLTIPFREAQWLVEDVKNNKHDIYLSDWTMKELNNPKNKKSKMLKQLNIVLK